MVHVHKRKKDEDDEQGPLVSERKRELSRVDVNDMWSIAGVFQKLQLFHQTVFCFLHNCLSTATFP
jgi:hypothetical protein